jgi:hypothetical protein
MDQILQRNVVLKQGVPVEDFYSNWVKIHDSSALKNSAAIPLAQLFLPVKAVLRVCNGNKLELGAMGREKRMGSAVME